VASEPRRKQDPELEGLAKHFLVSPLARALPFVFASTPFKLSFGRDALVLSRKPWCDAACEI
jgi:hypothetical protein